MNKSLITIFLLWSGSLFAVPTILIVGGGPSGLATAIEAHQAGAHVVVVEKRASYTREQWLLLSGDSVQRLKRWKVDLPNMIAKELSGRSVGYVAINHLEECLAKRIKELEIERIEGKFVRFGSGKTAVVTDREGEKQLLYDILVGADGMHSRVRKALEIDLTDMGKGKGASAIIPLPPKPRTFEISPPLMHGNLFLRRIKTPEASIIFTQSPSDGSKEALIRAILEEGWDEEIAQIEQEAAFLTSDINISLQQATTFYHEGKGAILIGDAAATASFFKGMGANTALKTAEIAGQFFKEQNAKEFTEAMKATTDALIEESRFLFAQKPE